MTTHVLSVELRRVVVIDQVRGTEPQSLGGPTAMPPSPPHFLLMVGQSGTTRVYKLHGDANNITAEHEPPPDLCTVADGVGVTLWSPRNIGITGPVRLTLNVVKQERPTAPPIHPWPIRYAPQVYAQASATLITPLAPLQTGCFTWDPDTGTWRTHDKLYFTD